MATRRALIVACSAYQDPKLSDLRSPAVDADRLAAVLRDPAIGDFVVQTALDQEERDLRRRVARFFSDSARDDVLLLCLWAWSQRRRWSPLPRRNGHGDESSRCDCDLHELVGQSGIRQ